MFLSSASNFYTWTTVSFATAGQEIKVHFQNSASVSLFQDLGLSSFLMQENLTLLVPSSDAVDKMSSNDRIFWTNAGNLATLVRSGLFLQNFFNF